MRSNLKHISLPVPALFVCNPHFQLAYLPSTEGRALFTGDLGGAGTIAHSSMSDVLDPRFRVLLGYKRSNITIKSSYLTTREEVTLKKLLALVLREVAIVKEKFLERCKIVKCKDRELGPSIEIENLHNSRYYLNSVLSSYSVRLEISLLPQPKGASIILVRYIY
ncbi:hypothetical protein BDU57DRAFT_526449 [Ampelomyces quisqualis]|uniref:Uncharacterized protein n=1 Tax=Ampelomyces quisqualis TaxID=50730 RepID=A0A6A5R4F5_AMPQU|nr:hypothetical protein BDU57DRAFT_526449 [Ampelomyces quisqualis]